MADVLLVNPSIPGQGLRDRVMNMGMMAVATALSRDFDVSILDSASGPSEALWRRVAREDIRSIGFSCASAQAFQSAMAFAAGLREHCPEIRIFAGGQHITGLYQSNLLQLGQGGVCTFVVGPGEAAARDLVAAFLSGGPVPQLIAGQPTAALERLNPFLHPNWPEMVPCIEVGRGCGHGCRFCNSSRLRVLAGIHLSPPHIVVEDACRILDAYGSGCDVMLGGAIFGDHLDHARETLRLLAERAPEAHYSFNLRCDCAWEGFFDQLLRLHIRSLFIGMESASPEVLRRMNKSAHPQDYLTRASRLFTALSSHNVPFHTAFMLGYWGEGPEDRCRTYGFIADHRQHMRSISVGRYWVFPGTPDYAALPDLCKTHRAEARLAPDGVSYLVHDPRLGIDDRIQAECQAFENEFTDPAYSAQVRGWRFRLAATPSASEAREDTLS
jgi:radical SAM superfamily enzyme YgiQ (UPF0313 family)